MVSARELSGALPDPGRCRSLDELVGELRRLKVSAGDPPYEVIKERVNAPGVMPGRPVTEPVGKSTVADCFRTGRRRLNTGLVLAVVWALHPDAGYVEQWRQALRVIAEGASAALQVRVRDELPEVPPGFAGRAGELELIRSAARRGDRIVISGMPGVGKTGLAVRAGRLLDEEQKFDRIAFVNLRGFDTDPDRPPADPAAVLEALLRLLGVPGPRVPRGLEARVAAYRDRLAGLRVLVVLDNAADSEQVRHLVADSPGSLTLVTSRRCLDGLPGTTQVGVDVFTPRDAEAFLGHAVRGVATGPDARAVARIAERCGFLPLALGVVAGLIRAQPGWTLTDHADRLDVRHEERRLDSAVELSLDVSYRHLPDAEQQLLRQLALHPGQDFDGYAAAALSAYEIGPARRHLRKLSDDNLLQCLSPGRYTFHDLVRCYAAARADDEEPPSGQRAALTRLFDNYLATAARAADTVYPDDVYRRPRVAAPGTPMPEFDSPGTALAWLETERPNLVAVAGHTLTHGWLTHTTRLSGTLKNYLDSGHFTDALTVHGHAIRAAALTGDQHRHASALASSGIAYLRLARYEAAAVHFRQALGVARQAGEHRIEASASGNLALVELTLGQFREANEHKEQALALYRQAGDRIGEASGLIGLGDIAIKLGRFVPAEDHLAQALALFRQIGHRRGEAWALDSFGTLHTHLGRRDRAVAHHQQALAIFRAAGDHEGETSALIGLGEAARAADNLTDALTHHTGALSIAVEIGDRFLQARAHTNLGHDHYALGDTVRAHRHYRAAAALNSGLDP